jgi:hypothetical protein
MYIQPYLFFRGHCEEAVQYYQKHLGAKVNMLMRYKDMPADAAGPGADYDGEKIMYGNLTIGDSVIMVSDDCVNPHVQFQGFLAFRQRQGRKGSRTRLHCIERWRKSPCAAQQDLLLAVLRYGGGSFRRQLDGHRAGPAVTLFPSPENTSCVS